MSGCACDVPQRLADCGECRLGGGSLRPAGLREVATATAILAAELESGRPHQLNGVKSLSEIRSDANHDPGLAVLAHTNDRNDPRADASRILC